MRHSDWWWRCQECGHPFPNVAAAERAAFGDEGCPECGGSDIDMSPPLVRRIRREEALTQAMVDRGGHRG